MSQRSLARFALVKPGRRSTQGRLRRMRGRLGLSGASGRRTEMTGRLSWTASWRATCISSSSQGPRPSRPTRTAMLQEFLMPSSSNFCQGTPGRSSSSSSQTARFLATSNFLDHGRLVCLGCYGRGRRRIDWEFSNFPEKDSSREALK